MASFPRKKWEESVWSVDELSILPADNVLRELIADGWRCGARYKLHAILGPSLLTSYFEETRQRWRETFKARGEV